MRDQTAPSAAAVVYADDGPGSLAWRISYRVSPGSLATEVGAETLFFSDVGQRLYTLTPEATQIWRALECGASAEDACRGLVEGGMASAAAKALVAELLDHWTANGDLYPQVLDNPGEPSFGLDLRIGGHAAQVRLEGGLDPQPFEAAFGQFSAEDGASGRSYRLAYAAGQIYAFVAGRCLGATSPEGAVPRLKGLLTEGLAASVTDGFLIHAACLHRGDHAWLLCGSPGAGKTTLTVALAAGAFDYASDDVTVLRHDSHVLGLPFAAAVKHGAWALCAPFAPLLERLPIHLRADGQRVRYLPAPPAASVGPAPLAGVVFLDRIEGHEPRLEPVAPSLALTRVLEAGYSPRSALAADEFLASARAVSGARSFVLTYSDVAQAVAALTELSGDV